MAGFDRREEQVQSFASDSTPGIFGDPFPYAFDMDLAAQRDQARIDGDRAAGDGLCPERRFIGRLSRGERVRVGTYTEGTQVYK